MRSRFTLRKGSATRRRRRGSIAVEILLILPLLLALLLVGIELAMYVSASQRLSAASALGARVAAQGGDEGEVERAVRQALGGGSLSRARIKSVVRDDQGQFLEAGDSIEVLVEVPVKEVGPSFLAMIGINWSGESLSSRTVMRKE